MFSKIFPGTAKTTCTSGNVNMCITLFEIHVFRVLNNQCRLNRDWVG